MEQASSMLIQVGNAGQQRHDGEETRYPPSVTLHVPTNRGAREGRSLLDTNGVPYQQILSSPNGWWMQSSTPFPKQSKTKADVDHSRAEGDLFSSF